MGRCSFVIQRGQFCGSQCGEDAGEDMFCFHHTKMKSAQRQAEEGIKPWRTREECLEEPKEKPLPEITVSRIEANYFMLDTGYTSRLLNNEDFQDWLDTTNEEGEDEEGNVIVGNRVELLFVNDDLWGEGLCKVGKDLEEVDRLIRILQAADLYKNGIACFRGRLIDCGSLVDQVKYCRIFSLIDVTVVTCGDDQIVVCEYDTGSG